MRNVAVSAIVAGVVLSVSSVAVQARPSMAWGDQFLNISESDCEQRAQSAFNVSGWTDVTYTGHTFVKAHKGDFSSYITCDAAARGGIVVNVFVAFEGTDGDGSLAGAQRDQLKAQMEKPQ